MDISKHLATLAMVGALCSAPVAADSVAIQQTSRSTVLPGSIGFDEVQRWLVEHTAPNAAPPPDWIVVNLTTQSTELPEISQNAVPGPPVPLPTSANVGDTLTITACSSGSATSTWTTVYTANGWVLTDYSVHYNTPACHLPGGGQ